MARQRCAQTIWITGARGFIGRQVGLMAGSGASVIAGIGHGAWSDREAARYGLVHWVNSEITVGSLGQLRSLTGVPDVVFHLAGGSSVGAAIANPHEDFQRTVGSTANLLEWLRQYSPETRLVAVSSAAVYGANHQGAICEMDTSSPVSPYGVHKLMMEEMCRSYANSYGIRVAVARLFSVYGPGLKKQLLWDLCEKIRSGKGVELGGTGDETRDWIHVADVCRNLVGMVNLADLVAPTLNVGTGIATSVRDIAAAVVRAWNPRAPWDAVIFNGKVRQGNPMHLVADISRMHASGLDTSVDIVKGIKEYVDWYRLVSG